jgi:FtsZ-binding cell division protein ZapB
LTEAQKQQSNQIANERLNLERQVLQALGNTIALREMELAVLNESNRVIQIQLYQFQDAEQALSDAIGATDAAFSQLQRSLSTQLQNTLTDLENQFNFADRYAKQSD